MIKRIPRPVVVAGIRLPCTSGRAHRRSAAGYGWKWFGVYLFATLPMQIGALAMMGTAWGPALFWAISALGGYCEYRERRS